MGYSVDMTDTKWEPTRHGGLRRTTQGSSDAQSAAQMKQRSETRKLPLGLKIEWRHALGLPECPYVYRWMLGHRKIGSIRLHHWLGPDDDRAVHDHPWWFVSYVLRGYYTDCADTGGTCMSQGVARFRPALHRHTVVPGPDGCWTLVLTGAVRRPWGFWPDGKFVKANKWFMSRGHHICDS